jgi:hypothetical protein
VNNTRREKLRSVAERLEALAQELIKIEDEERRAFGRRPIGLQYSESGFNSDDAAEKIQDLANTISNAACELSDIPSDH